MQPSNGGKLQAPPCSSRNRTAWSDIPKTELGQRRRSQHVRNESAYPPIAAGEQTSRLVGSVPISDKVHRKKYSYSITSSATAEFSVTQSGVEVIQDPTLSTDDRPLWV